MNGFGKRIAVVAVGAILIGVVNSMLGVEYSAAVTGNLLAGYFLGRVVGFIK